MTTDEQRMREQFEADCLHIDEGQLARTKAGDYATEWVHGTWIGYAIAYKARDAEVQALRKLVDHAKRIFQNAEVRSGYCMCGETPERHSADCGYVDRGQWESDLWLKREAAIERAEGGGP